MTGAPSAVEAYQARPINPHRLAALRAHAGEVVVDVGCGNGSYVEALAATHRVVGFDWKMFPAWKAGAGSYGVSDASRLPLRTGSVDTVACFETLEHLSDPERALREYHRVARRNLVLTVPNCEVSPGQRASNHIFHHWIDPTHVNFWSTEEIGSLVRSVGFDLIEVTKVNEVDLRPLVLEAYARSRVGRALLRALLRLRRHRPYPMTTLIVAQRRDG